MYDITYNRTLPSAVGYGMTESSGIITHMIKGSSKHESVGGPIPNTEMKVVHVEKRSDLAARQIGEICMRGPQVRGREGERELSGFDAFHTLLWHCYFI
jgi:long-subunit acyl-CoA synthetase (AMP-forming)